MNQFLMRCTNAILQYSIARRGLEQGFGSSFGQNPDPDPGWISGSRAPMESLTPKV